MSAIKNMQTKAPVIPSGVERYSDYYKLMDQCQLNEKQRKVVTDFATRSGSRLLGKDGKNNVFSPLSLYVAAAMLASGADEGEAKEELLRFLGADSIENVELLCKQIYEAVYYQGLLNKLGGEGASGKKPAVISLHNAFWMSDKNAFNESFVQDMNNCFYASTAKVDFTNPKAGEEISEWVEKKTSGLIKPGLQFDNDALAALINTLYFYGSWEDEFDRRRTKERQFHMADGKAQKTDFMFKRFWDCYGTKDQFKVIDLALSGPYKMRLVLPDQGIALQEILSSEKKLQNALAMECDRYADITLRLPRFEHRTRIDLMSQARELGIGNALENASYSRISPDQVRVNAALQESCVKMNEEGVEGAAMTYFGMAAAGIPLAPEEKITLTFDRPFLYGIQDLSNDLWMFLGVYERP